ncbi:MAG TPA: M20 family metallopeptidase [Burkholderiaceae bacterium]|nr:M20 family metallopeptidase [Burkholderiaceae bacterium]
MDERHVADRVLQWLSEHEQEMLELLETLVNIDSGSYDKEGVDQVRKVLQAHLQQAGVATEVFPLDKHGDCLLATVPGQGSDTDAHVLLLGHMDTVFPRHTVAERPFEIRDGRAYGPGVADMKSGLVMNTFIACAFHALQCNQRPIKVFYTSDEEIASPSSRQLTLKMAEGAATVLNAEPGRPNGNVVVERKGAFFIDFEVNGVAAHAGVNHHKGASAIGALAHKVIDLHGLTNPETGVTTNIGTVQGGVSINTVAPHARGQLDVRYPGSVDHAQLHEQIVSIIEHTHVPGTQARLTSEGKFLPLLRSDVNQALFEDYQRAAAQLGITVDSEAAGGSADSGLAASMGAPTLCATGPVGGLMHTVDEYLEVDTMVPRAQAAALTILARDAQS